MACFGGGSSVPPPRPFSANEEAFLGDTKLTLQQLRGMLSDQSLQNTETQGVLKNLSGLYEKYDVPEKPGDISLTRGSDIDALNAYALDRPFSLSLHDAQRYSSRSSGFNRRGSEVANDLLGAGLDLNMPVADAVKLLQTDKEAALKYGFAQRGPSTPSGIEFRVNQDAVNALKGKLDTYQAAQDELTRKSQEAQGAGLEALQKQIETNLKLQQTTYEKLQEELSKGPSDLEKSQAEIAQLQADALKKRLSEGPTAYEKAQEDIGLMQAERLQKALKGELPVSEGTLQRKEQDFKLLQEAAARRGSPIEGDTPETAFGQSSAAAQNLGEFNRTYSLIQDAERRGEITSGAGINQGQYGLMSGIDAQRTGQNLANYSLQSGLGAQQFGQYQSLYGQTGAPGNTYNAAPGASSLGFLQSQGGYGPGASIPGYQSLLGGYSQAMQPYTDQRNAQYMQQYQQAALNSQNDAAWMGLLGQIGGAGTTALILCFDPDTQVKMADGSTKAMKDVVLGDVVSDGARVTSVRDAEVGRGTFFIYDGVKVTGSHAVKEDGVWLRVRDSKRSLPVADGGLIRCLGTTTHRLFIEGIEFADEFETDLFGQITPEKSLEILNKEVVYA